MKKTVNGKMATAEIIRPRDLPWYTGLSKTTIWRLEKEGGFVQRIRLSQHCIGYRKIDIDEWIDARIELTAEGSSNNEK